MRYNTHNLGPLQTLRFGHANVVSNLIDQLSSTIVRLKLDIWNHVEPASCSTTEVVVLHDRGATRFQTSSFSQASLVPNSVLIRHVFIQNSADHLKDDLRLQSASVGWHDQT